MAASKEDPTRATLLAILKQLNQAEVGNEGRAVEQALELSELQQRLFDFWAVKQGSIKVSLALGLLLRNKLVTTQSAADYSWQRQRDSAQRYIITAEGKKFLVDSLTTSDRIPPSS
ncbi:MAG: hypothetical protein WCA77_02445 [Thermoplasmata archaeon]